MARNHDGGYTLVELAVVLAIVAILVAIMVSSLEGFRSRANDARATSSLSHAATAEMGLMVADGAFSTDAGRLTEIAPGIDLGSADTSVRVVVADVKPGDSAQVLLYARSRSGTWFGARLAVAGGARGHFTCREETEAEMTLAVCTGRDW